MKKALTVAALAMFGFAPAVGADCGGHDASMATTVEPAKLVAAPVPAATKAPGATVAKATTPKLAKQALAKTKAPAPDTKLAAATSN